MKKLGKFGKRLSEFYFVYLWFIDCGSKMVAKTGKCFHGIDFVDTFPLEKILGWLSLKRFFSVFFRAVFVVCLQLKK